MLDSILLYTGAMTAATGLAAVVHPLRVVRLSTRSRAAVVFIVGAALMSVAAALPISDKRSRGEATLLDKAMPLWQFDEHHQIRIAAPPDAVYRAMRAVTADEITLFRTLTAIRRGGRSAQPSIVNAPHSEPLLDVATRTTFVVVADAPPNELVVGTCVIKPRHLPPGARLTREVFYGAVPEGAALAAMNFRIAADGPRHSLLSTETRVCVNGSRPARQFAIYWRVIHPGSDIIRRMWLRAIRRRAENPPPA